MNQRSILNECGSVFPRQARKDQCSILSDGESVLNLERAENCGHYKMNMNQCSILSARELVLVECARSVLKIEWS